MEDSRLCPQKWTQVLSTEALGLWSAAVRGVHFQCLGAPDAWCELWYPHHLSPMQYFQPLKYPSQCMRRFLAWLVAEDTSGFFWVISKGGLPPGNLHLCELPWELAKLKVSSGSRAEICSCHPLSKASLTMSITCIWGIMAKPQVRASVAQVKERARRSL